MSINTKIVATLGPERSMHDLNDQYRREAVAYADLLPWLVAEGVDVFRLNMSHRSVSGDRERSFLDAYRDTRYLWESRARHVAILGDLQGPKIRIGDFLDDQDATIELQPGDKLVLHTKQQIVGNEKQVAVLFEGRPFLAMSEHVKKGDQIWLGDGEALLEVKAVSTRDGSITCEVRSMARIKGRRGVTVKDVSFPLESFTAKDKDDLKLLLSFGAELTYVALSFVQNAEDILKVKYFIQQEYEKQGMPAEEIPVRMPGLIAKIETREAVDNIDEILDVVDGVMVARGDLGMQVGLKDVARIQKLLIHKANVRGKPVITATQMLDSMERNQIPTRAEVTDIYNAILDGTDAIMLSGETSKGPYPIQAVRVMSEVAGHAEKEVASREDRLFNLLREAEASLPATQARVSEKKKRLNGRSRQAEFYRQEYLRIHEMLSTQHITDRISHAACSLSLGIKVKAIIAPSTSGQTTRMVSRFRPLVPIVGVVHDYCVARKLTLCYGVYPVNILRSYTDNEAIFKAGCDAAKKVKRRSPAMGNATSFEPLIQADDSVVVTAGYPLFKPGTTNLVKLHLVT